MTIDEMIAVLQAYKEGKKIQCKQVPSGIWCTVVPNWNFRDCDYRIKPGPYYRPFKDAEEVMEAIKEHGDWVKYDTCFDRIVALDENSVNTVCTNMEYGKALKKYLFLDGTPFGKLED